MESFFEQYKSSQIHYYKSRNSNNKPVLLCFHGYGESGVSFSFLEKYIENDFIIIAIDLPFHGKTEWSEGLIFTQQDLLKIIQQIINTFSGNNPEIYFLGFSMGARVALDLLLYWPNQIKKIVLLAPDGLKINGWYWFATQTVLGNNSFRFVMNNPRLFLTMLHAANKIHMINQSIYKFMDHYINNKQVRIDLFNRWTTMRKFKPDLQKIKSLIMINKIPVKLIYGEHDRIIRFETGKKFMHGIEKYCTLKIIPSGHQVLQEKNIELIVDLLKN
jgi:pimeloyl-ACP methyl ester carboxylesterase